MIQKFRFALGALLLILFFSCAGDDMANSAPLWANDELKSREDYLLFTALGRGMTRDEALDDLGQILVGKILTSMGYSEEDFADFPEERAYLDRLFRAISEGEGSLPGGELERTSWFHDGEQMAVAAQFRYGRPQYEEDSESLRLYLSGGDKFYSLLARAEELHREDYSFSAFLYDMEAAWEGHERGGMLAPYLKGKAFAQGTTHLDNVPLPLLEGADTVYLGARHSWPYEISIPLSPREDQVIPWKVEMTLPGEDIPMEISLPSDYSGRVELSYPFPSVSGEGKVRFSLTPGDYDELFNYLTILEADAEEGLKSALNRFTLEKVLPVKRDRRELKTALIIEDRDGAGRLLDSQSTEESVFGILKEENYAVERVDFDLESLRGLSELEMVREFNSHYGNNYDIILFCEAGIRNFTQKGDLFQVDGGAVLYEADLWEHRINVIEDISSSVSGSDPSRLVSSAFFQLGTNIAEACFKLN
ncbi:MAG: hypothetical protein PQJ59_14115 [Spirochaetales bacterium]|nr:hypothetical protein [Spirochaetales bacterium]